MPMRLKRTLITTHELAPANEATSISVVRLDFEPGQPTGRHMHAMPVIGYVLEGAFVVKIAGQPERSFTAGQSICEPADTTIERFDNASSTEPAVLIAHYLAGPGESELIRLLPPT